MISEKPRECFLTERENVNKKTGENCQMLKNGHGQLSVSLDVHQNKKPNRKKKIELRNKQYN